MTASASPRPDGRKGLFTAIVVAMITAEIYRQFIQRDFTIKMPKGVPDAVGRSFAALIPAPSSSSCSPPS